MHVRWLPHGQGGRRGRRSSTQQYTPYHGSRPGLPAKTRGPSHAPGGRHHHSSKSTPRFTGRGPGRPVKTRRLPHELSRTTHIKPISQRPQLGPAHQISNDGPRPGPANQFFTRWPGPSIFQNSRPGPARPINFSKLSARPSATHQIVKTLGPAQRDPSNFQTFRPGPARPGPSRFQNSRPTPARLVTILRSGTHLRPMTRPEIITMVGIWYRSTVLHTYPKSNRFKLGPVDASLSPEPWGDQGTPVHS